MNYADLPLQMRVDIANAALAHAEATTNMFAAFQQYDMFDSRAEYAHEVVSRTAKTLDDLQFSAAKMMKG